MLKSALLALVFATTTVSPLLGYNLFEEGDCEVMTESGAAPSAGDRTKALAACDVARERFSELFGDPVPRVLIIFWDEPRYRMGLLQGEAAIFWPTSEAMTPERLDPVSAELHLENQWQEVLPHEISHLLLAVRFFRDGRDAAPGEYGTPLPDWIDEGVAIWAEPKESREKRVAQARELPAEYLDLRRILEGSHPAAGNSAAYTSRDGTARPADFELWAFYPQSIAVLTFVHEHGGTAATSELVQRLINSPGNPLVLAGLPGLPDDFEGVEAAWKEWLAGDRGVLGEAP